MPFFCDTPLIGLFLCGSTGYSCQGLLANKDDEDDDLVSSVYDRIRIVHVKSLWKDATAKEATEPVGDKGAFVSFDGNSRPSPPRLSPMPLWLQQAELDNASKVVPSDSDSDDNYSYDDDEADHKQRLSDYEQLRTHASTCQAKRPITTFDVELHDLLTKIGDTDEGSLDECVLRHEFEAMDADGDGSLDVIELAGVFDKLGIQAKPYKLMNLISIADLDGNGTIEWPEFSKLVRLGVRWNTMLQELGTNLAGKRGQVLDFELKKEFDKIDVDGNGSLDQDELRQLFANLNIPCDPAMISQLVAMADKDNNGTIEMEEFRKLFHVMGTVSKMTRPRKNTRKVIRQSACKSTGGGKKPPPRQRPSCVEWQTIIASVGQQIQKKNIPINDKTLKKEFDRIDTSKDGSLDVSELASMFTDLGISLDNGQVKNLVAMADDDGNDTIEWPEFKRMFDITMKWHEFLMKLGKSLAGAGPLNDTVLRRQFISIDKDNSGSLDREEMKEVFTNLGIQIDDSMLSKLLVLVDDDGSGAIEWPEFKRMFKMVRQLGEHHESSKDRFR